MRHQKGFKKIISPDLRAVSFQRTGQKKQSTLVLRPGEQAIAELHRSWLMPKHPNGGLMEPQTGTRSVLARLGIEILNLQEHVHEARISGKTPTRVLLNHRGEFPIRLQRGNAIMRYYFPHLAKNVGVEEVRRQLKKGELVLGKDFKILPSGMLEIRIQPVVWEVPHELKEKMSKENWAAGSKRKKLMSMLRRVNKKVKLNSDHIVLTETMPLKIPENRVLFLLKTTDGNSAHIHSLIVDPGFQGPVVLELMGHHPQAKADSILAFLAKAPES